MPIERVINPINVTKAARFILEMDKAAIQESLQPDVQEAIVWVQDSLEDYLCFVDTSGLNLIDYHERQLKELIQAVRNLLSHLTPDAQARIKQYLTDETYLNKSTSTLQTQFSQPYL